MLYSRVHPNRAAKPPCLDGPHLKIPKHLNAPLAATAFHRRITPFTCAVVPQKRTLTMQGVWRRKERATAVDDSTQVVRTLKATPLIVVVHPKYVQHPAARTITTHVMDALSSLWPSCANLLPDPAALQQPIRLADSCANLRPSLSTGKRRAHLTLLQPTSHVALRQLSS